MIVLDLETSSTDPGCEITQIAMARCDRDFDIEDEFEVKVQFDVSKADPEALEVNHYDPKVWKKDAIPVGEALRACALFTDTDPDEIQRKTDEGKNYTAVPMVAFNSHFDLGVLIDWVEKLREKNWSIYIRLDRHALCLRQLAQWYFHLRNTKYPGKMKLQYVAKYFGIVVDEARVHDASYDVQLLCKVAKIIVPRIHVK